MYAHLRRWRLVVVGLVSAVAVSSCSFSPYDLPLPGGASTGSDPYKVKIEFRDVLDLVPQSAVKVDDVSVGKVTDIRLNGWNAEVTVSINHKVKLPDNAEAQLRQTNLLGEKFVSLEAPATDPVGRLGNGDVIPLARAGRNPEIEEVLGALSLVLNGGGIEKTATITRELNNALGGREPELRSLIADSGDFIGQLDDNKDQILTALERVDRLAKETNKQKKAIVGAVDNLPAALKTVNEQRDDLVKLLNSLHSLSDVGTNVIKQSKDATVNDLKKLTPVLKEIAAAGDDLPKSLSLLTTYPIPDASVGRTPVEARNNRAGDYTNLSVRLDLSLDNLSQGLDLSSLGIPTNQNALKGLEGLLKGTPTKPKDKKSKSKQNTPVVPGVPSLPEVPGLPSLPSVPAVCGLVGLLCRPAPASSPGTTEPALSAGAIDNDTASLLLTPVVAQ